MGSFRANAFGVHDLLGNVWEWTADHWNESHMGAAPDGRARMPQGMGNWSLRVLRGGSWLSSEWAARSAYRGYRNASDRYFDIGFRVARTL